MAIQIAAAGADVIEAAQKLAWQFISNDKPEAERIAFNSDAAIFKKWVDEKARVAASGAPVVLGLPISDELAGTDGTSAQPFSSGFVVHWDGSNTELK